MRWKEERLPVLRIALATLLFGVAASFSFWASLSVHAVDVSLNVPVGTIRVQGKTSPNAQVKIFENGSEIPASSITAAVDGSFSEELPQDSAGLVDIGAQAIDTDGKESILITKQVAVVAQQTTTLSFILPPTIAVTPDTATFGEGTLIFEGQTVPNATVRLTIEPSTTLTVVSDGQGNFEIPLLVASLTSVGEYRFGVEVEIGAEISDYVIAGTFFITPQNQPPLSNPPLPIEKIIDRFTNEPIAVPEIISPSEDEITTSDPIIISGRASPGTIITIYDEGVVIGTVMTREDGTWQFYFAPHKEKHSISVKACEDSRCSAESRTVTILRPKSEPTPLCHPGISLETYRIQSTAGSPLKLIGYYPEGQMGTAYISWGDRNSERIESIPGDNFEASHAYQEVGTYSGYVTLSDGKKCQTATYFVVEVSNPAIPTLVIVSVLFVLLAVALIRLFYTRRLLIR